MTNVLLGKEQELGIKTIIAARTEGGIYYAPGMGPDRDSVFIIFLNFISIN